jgi:hypothetical protein
MSKPKTAYILFQYLITINWLAFKRFRCYFLYICQVLKQIEWGKYEGRKRERDDKRAIIKRANKLHVKNSLYFKLLQWQQWQQTVFIRVMSLYHARGGGSFLFIYTHTQSFCLVLLSRLSNFLKKWKKTTNKQIKVS